MRIYFALNPEAGREDSTKRGLQRSPLKTVLSTPSTASCPGIWQQEFSRLDLREEAWACAKIPQSCLTLCDTMDCGPPGSSVHAVLQARIPERVAISSSRGSS